MKKVWCRGFSLIELMVVILILAIISAVAIPEFQRYLRKAKNTEAVMALGSLNKTQIVTFSETGHFAYCETDLTGVEDLWARGQKFPLSTNCSDSIRFSRPEGAYSHFSYRVVPGKYTDGGVLDPAIDAAATLVTPPVNFETSTAMFSTLNDGASCNGSGAGVVSMTGVGLGLDPNPTAGYAYYVAHGVANLSGSGASFMALSGEACSLIFQTVEFDPLSASKFAVSPIVIYSFGE